MSGIRNGWLDTAFRTVLFVVPAFRTWAVLTSHADRLRKTTVVPESTRPMDVQLIARTIASSYIAPATGRPAFLGDAAKIQVLLSEMIAGTHLEPACALAGLSSSTVRSWLKAGDADESTPEGLFSRAVREARATVEAKISRNVIKASETPAFWTAGITYLERTAPERWARPSDRQERGVSAIEVHVHGINRGDVNIGIRADVPAHVPPMQPSQQIIEQFTTDAQTESQRLSAEGYPQGLLSPGSDGAGMHRGPARRAGGPSTHAPLRQERSEENPSPHAPLTPQRSEEKPSPLEATAEKQQSLSEERAANNPVVSESTNSTAPFVNPAQVRRETAMHAQARRERYRKKMAKKRYAAARYVAKKHAALEAKKAEAALPDEV